MEAIISIVGFLGAGKTTLLKQLVNSFTTKNWNPFIILNDYENAYMDAQHFTEQLQSKTIKALSGSCICCSGIVELRDNVNRILERKNGITLIEANGTSNACALIEFLGVGVQKRFLPPVQIAVVDVENWQKRGIHNELEANQIQVSSLLVLTHITEVSDDRKNEVIRSLKDLNPYAKIVTTNDIDVLLLPGLTPSNNTPAKFDHLKAHWSSCSVDLPTLPNNDSIELLCKALPSNILRVKGCVQIKNQKAYTYFECKPNGKIVIRAFNGIPITGTKLLTIGPGSEPSLLEKAIQTVLEE